ncbi:glycosyltransferase [Tamlana sp. 2_MG-2023]|uniref:glycosyltransferase n=1 Tax=unclassified Tamlana TaxID=2614803 RepID=UPI0026E2E823|nr:MULTISPECIES: glycosyltransferase [unclassified Tamlana]MDO6760252.1 glycosyltransferase [Tamlana sp. 2_MG-2023]MDO6790050.1 glycosyltransferase [Tamlana sp. 1_MG-2023]
MKILVLFTKLTGYWMACMQHDASINNNRYLVFRKTPSPDAPFQLNSTANITLKDVDSLDLDALQQQVKTFKPDLIYVAGWIDKRYLQIAKSYKKSGIPVITGMDNQWLGTPKQHLASFLSPVFIRPYFSHIWVAGMPQYYYAKKLGFKSTNILTGLYCADENLFKNTVQTTHNNQFVFIGRLVEHKGLKVFFKVLNELIHEERMSFKVHIIGNGPLANQIPKHNNIKHTPFVNPEALPKLLENAGTFILPSLYEAWGVVVHEAALAGMPIITTEETGAASEFVINNYNGHTYQANDTEALKKLLLKYAAFDETTYLKYSKHSKQFAHKINLNDWSAKINSIIRE